MKPSGWVREEGQRTSKIPQKIRRSEGKKSGTSVVGPVSNIQLNTSPVTAEVPENNIKKEMQKLDTSVGKYKKCIKNSNALVNDFSDLDMVLELKIINKDSIIVTSGQYQLLAL
ncbi:hypothetical protein BDR07DRAFT_1371322 [Suillus spraguei]|nr:hypothetical protein BDR07DRAFT_1371322 [Suillus spraguei]